MENNSFIFSSALLLTLHSSHCTRWSSVHAGLQLISIFLLPTLCLGERSFAVHGAETGVTPAP